MLAEKFFLFLETLIWRLLSQTATCADGAPKVISQSAFVPIKSPDAPKQAAPTKRPFFAAIGSLFVIGHSSTKSRSRVGMIAARIRTT